MKIFITILFLLFSVAGAQAQEKFLTPTHLIIYRPMDFGSHALFNPITYYFNWSFDSVQNTALFTEDKYFENHLALWDRVKNPVKAISQSGGFHLLLMNEFLTKRAITNVALHMVGGGFMHRQLGEWFKANHYPYPYLWSFIIATAGDVGNEALEVSNRDYVDSKDHVADLFFYNLAGKVLFTNDDVSHFFYNKMQMRNWSFQPMYALTHNRIFNAGENFIFRPYLFGKKIRPFVFSGMQVLGGVSLWINSGEYVTFAAGVTFLDPFRDAPKPLGGIFFDRDDSLLLSLFINGSEDYKLRCNIYPGIVKLKGIKLGVMVALTDNNRMVSGLNFNMPLGIGAQF